VGRRRPGHHLRARGVRGGSVPRLRATTVGVAARRGPPGPEVHVRVCGLHRLRGEGTRAGEEGQGRRRAREGGFVAVAQCTPLAAAQTVLTPPYLMMSKVVTYARWRRISCDHSEHRRVHRWHVEGFGVCEDCRGVGQGCVLRLVSGAGQGRFVDRQGLRGNHEAQAVDHERCRMGCWG
jgi:hypothetical protein